MPPGVQVKALDDHGLCIVTTAERYNRFIDAHRDRSETVRASLVKAGQLARNAAFPNKAPP